MRYLFKGYQSGKWSENSLAIDIKIIERVKNQTMFQTKMADFNGK